ncbi:MAG: pyridoxal-phosphate dependent enzyme, partial [Deltaproteobacteria bacterium]|nr:pyridoxal-phosphate dependent enzyme [Deltaproteobacteria bacterium]
MTLEAGTSAPAGGRQERIDVAIVGHVDHGKSTVVGRLLADTGCLPEGKLEQLQEVCRRNAKPFEYAFLLDALKAEQAQGITIDTARCFMRLPDRDYAIHDTPGHIEFLKNMITGAARAEAAFLVIDALEGVRENSKRHGYILSMLGIPQVTVLLNKMDQVGYAKDSFDHVRTEYERFLARLGVAPLAFIPVSARQGANIAVRNAELAWYEGPTVLQQLQSFRKMRPRRELPLRLPVQDVYKFTGGGDDRRIVAGNIVTGFVRRGDEVVFLPSGKRSIVARVEGFPAPPPGQEASAGAAVGVTLTEQIFVRPGDLLVRAMEPSPRVGMRFRASVFWMGRAPFLKGKRYVLKLASARVPVQLREVIGVLDAAELVCLTNKEADRHDVAEVVLETERPLAFDLGCEVRETGRFVLVDDREIAGAGIVLEQQDVGLAAVCSAACSARPPVGSNGSNDNPAAAALRRYESVEELIGRPGDPTPLVRLGRVLGGAKLETYAKLEWFNPFGSIKDRTALYLLRGLRERGLLDGRELVEPTSGNTGIALAALAAVLKLKIKLTIPDGVPEEKKVLLRMLGAEVWPTPDDLCPIDHPKDRAIALARSLVDGEEGRKRFVMPNQYDNPDNVRAHYETTGPE